MKMFIGIIGCSLYSRKGWHQVNRDTFLKGTDVDYKFFIGDKTPSTEDDEAAIQASCGGLDRTRGIDYGQKCRLTSVATALQAPYTPIEKDEVMLACPDDFTHLPIKLKHMIRWALERHYTHFFRADSDTYIDIPRLMACGFENHEVMAHPSFGGGCGWILNRHAMQLLANEPVSHFVDEVWAGRCLARCKVPVKGDVRFSDSDVATDNDLISTHCGWMAGYVPQRMYDLHRRLKG